MRNALNKRLVAIILSGVFLCTCSAAVTADKLSQAKASKSSLNKKLNQIQSKKQAVKDAAKKLETQKKVVASTQAKENEKYNQMVSDLKKIESEIKKIDQAVDMADQSYNEQKKLLKTRLRVMYENNNTSTISALVKSRSLTDFFQKLELISLISKRDKQLVEDLNSAKEDVEYKKQQREIDKKQLLGLADQKRQQLVQLKTSRAGLEERLKESEQQLKILERQEDELEKQSKEWDSIIRGLSKKSTTKYIGGNMLWPVPSSSKISSGYGYRIHPILRRRKFHAGIDISASKGVSIVAAAKGTVILAKYSNGYGNTVIIDHGGGITTLYAHASKILVRVGESVSRGDVIAKVGSTGLSTGPHLHFELRKNGAVQNPLGSVNK